MGKRYYWVEEDDNAAGEAGVFAAIAMAVLAIIATLFAIVFLFGTVGAIFGAIVSIGNYFKAMVQNISWEQEEFELKMIEQ